MAFIDFLVKVLCESPDEKPRRLFHRQKGPVDEYKPDNVLICPYFTIPKVSGLYVKFLKNTELKLLMLNIMHVMRVHIFLWIVNLYLKIIRLLSAERIQR